MMTTTVVLQVCWVGGKKWQSWSVPIAEGEQIGDTNSVRGNGEPRNNVVASGRKQQLVGFRYCVFRSLQNI